MKRLAIFVLLAGIVALPLVTLTPPKRADAVVIGPVYTACLRAANAIPGTSIKAKIARRAAIFACHSANFAKLALLPDVAVAATSDGYHTGPMMDTNYLDIVAISPVTVRFDFPNGDPTGIELFLVNPANNPADPAFGVSVGTDNAAPWEITFNPDIGGVGPWDGALYVEAAGLSDSAADSIYVTRDSDLPLVGGIVVDQDLGALVLQSDASSSSDAWLLTGGLAIAAAGAIVLGGGVWCVRRRRMR
jgi:hypothetical protein